MRQSVSALPLLFICYFGTKKFTDDILSAFNHRFERDRGFRYFNARFVVAVTAVVAVVFILDVFCVYHSHDLFTFMMNLRGFFAFSFIYFLFPFFLQISTLAVRVCVL